MNLKDSFGMFLRYIILILVALPSLYLFYLIFTPLTLYPSYWILSIFHDVALWDSSFIIGNSLIQIIPACIAGSAYYLLLILNLTTPMKPSLRVKSLAFLLLSLLFFNILRLVVFTSLFVAGFSYFDLAHKAVWYFGSTLFVVILWFLNVYLFKLREIPAYSDMKRLYGEIAQHKKRAKR
jgi:hypothetical protein